MNLSEINWLAVIVVTILSFFLGALWHSPLLFGKMWKQELKRDENLKVNFALIFGLSAIGNFVALVALDAFIGSNASAAEGLLKGFIISIAWVSSSIGVTYLFASRSLKLFLIDAGFYVVLFSAAGLILGAW